MKNTFNTNLPYRVVEVKYNDNIVYKIKQPLVIWIFGNTVNYYDIKQSYFGRHYITMTFYSKNKVDEFVLKQQKKIIKPIETIVFDSLFE